MTSGAAIKERLVEIISAQRVVKLVNDPVQTRDLAEELVAWGCEHEDFGARSPMRLPRDAPR